MPRHAPRTVFRPLPLTVLCLALSAHAQSPAPADTTPAAPPAALVSAPVAPDAGACLLPPMLLQPLVENAVKHGIGNRIEGGTVCIAAERAGSLLRIRVENDADEEGAASPAAGCGIGLANVRQRLAATYAHEASVFWTHTGGSFRVELALPVETTPVMES